MKLLSLLSILLSFNAVANTGETCVAIKKANIGYGSTMKYVVNCPGESFTSKRIITMILLPLPYNWGKVARKHLYKLMSEKKRMEEVLKFNPSDKIPRSDNLPIHVFKKNGVKLSQACALSYGNKKSIGINKETVYDIIVKCSNGSRADYFSGVTVKDVSEILEGQGLERSLEFESIKNFFYVESEQIKILNAKTIIFEK